MKIKEKIISIYYDNKDNIEQTYTVHCCHQEQDLPYVILDSLKKIMSTLGHFPKKLRLTVKENE